ncbi:hypothetical protein [Fibrobacter sp. UWR2]|uniref:hypothetical protein n=1 Tax=Fibrobacter sp. UWR2 TaxID=1964352 RepID=UPI000B522ED8|nr:hypothetical protein [Fibrobacter sp. UWR2]OWU99958.1 hypothetical protein B7994_09820 [Fibrobacter sp. UWR2]
MWSFFFAVYMILLVWGEFPDFLPGLRESILRSQREGSLRFVENLKGVDRDRVLCILRGKPNPSAEEREIAEKVFQRAYI